MKQISIILFAVTFCCYLAIPSNTSSAEDITFNRDIRPILSDKCFKCHGPDEKAVDDGLRLDLRESAIEFSAIVPGKPEKSELMERVLSDDGDLQMPPPDSGKTLTTKEIATLKKWIVQGAKYDQHWAFVPPKLAPLPKVKNEKWVKNPIDRFILAKLEQNNMVPSANADKVTLIRRLTLDLTGLPPTANEVNQFLQDSSPDAYEKVVDRLLMSKHYGERMAINWLDYARYADSNGFQSDGSRDMWAWRDWVINAYNENQPFDQFTIEQVAGDMLPNPTNAQIIATGFNRNHRLNGEGGFIPEEWFVETVIDRVETTGLTWLGLTFNCCRCHDHKFDPISQKEFYQLFAYFNSCDETGVLGNGGKNGVNTPPILKIETDDYRTMLAQLNGQLNSARDKLISLQNQTPALLKTWEANLGKGAQKNLWTTSDPTTVRSMGGATLVKQPGGTFLATQKNPAQDTYEIVFGDQQAFSGFLLRVFPDPSLPGKSLGRSSNGNFVLTSIEAEIVSAKQAKQVIKFSRIEADFAQENWPAGSVLTTPNANNKKGWAIAGFAPENKVERRIMFVADKKYVLNQGDKLTLRLVQKSQYAQHTIGRFRIELGTVNPAQLGLSQSGIPSSIQQILSLEKSKRSIKQKSVLQKYFIANVDNPVRDAKQKVDQLTQSITDLKNKLPSTMVMKEGKQRDAFVLVRGEYDKPDAKVERGIPSVLPSLPQGQPNNRLGFARWLVDESNPLTARVWVNRQWEMFFGTGIVKTTENFGSQAEFPSHPELLDWLASNFMTGESLPNVNGVAAQRWDMKAIHKLIVMSASYQQTSKVTASQIAKDPDNRLCGRATRFRLSGELIRDQALAAGGLLVPIIGGPSVRPYMPPGVWSETTRYGNLRNYTRDKGEGLYRRTLYTIWKRTAAPPTMLMFDAPNREACTIKRSKTNTPLQALSLLNEITFVEAARGLANRMLDSNKHSSKDAIAFGFQLALSRPPSASEINVLSEGFRADLAHFQKNPGDAQKLVAVGESKNTSEADQAKLAAYILTANIIFNLDEFVTRE